MPRSYGDIGLKMRKSSADITLILQCEALNLALMP